MKMAFLILATAFSFSGFASEATQKTTFEKSFQEAGRKVDEAAARTEELRLKAQREIAELSDQTKATRLTWSERITGAWEEFKTGSKKAWSRLQGEGDAQPNR